MEMGFYESRGADELVPVSSPTPFVRTTTRYDSASPQVRLWKDLPVIMSIIMTTQRDSTYSFVI